MTSTPLEHSHSGLEDWIAFAAPLVVVVAFFVSYLISPQFYLNYIIEFSRRETQAVEILTWTTALGAALILFVCAALQWKISSKAPGGSMLPGGAVFIFLVALSAFFFAGEELSWGQTWFHWKTPTEIQGISRETNLHNGKLGHLVHFAGDLFIIVMFIVLPIVWAQRHRLNLKLPADWKPGIAEWPVLACTVLGFAVVVPKSIWMMTHPLAARAGSPFYMNYLEELHEQKEMLYAFAMLIYALYRIRAVRRERAAARGILATQSI